jgi:peptidyl-Asp metalloendopeptidase
MIRLLSGLAAALFATTLLASTASAATAEPWQLQPAPLLRALSLSPGAVESWQVHLDGQPPAHGANWRLPLPEGLSEWRTDGLELSANGDFRWRGKAADGTDEHAVIVRRGEAMSGLLSTRDGLYEVIPSADGNLLVRLDSSRFPACAGADEPPEHHAHGHSHAPAAATPPATIVPEGGTVQIDVLVVYSPQARDAVGGVSQIEAVIQAAVDASNQAFENSQATPRFNLVGARLTNRNDSGSSATDLSWVSSNAEVAQWRNELGADMVGLISENIGSSCGRGFVMRNVGPGFASSAFQVTARGCAVGNLTYAHEHGHNMGMEHDPANGTSSANASYPYSFGHFVSGNYRTVMSYSSECTGVCPRRPYFSNPDVIFSGQPTGIANQRDNARTADNVAPIVAAFRATADGVFDDGFE